MHAPLRSHGLQYKHVECSLQAIIAMLAHPTYSQLQGKHSPHSSERQAETIKNARGINAGTWHVATSGVLTRQRIVRLSRPKSFDCVSCEDSGPDLQRETGFDH